VQLSGLNGTSIFAVPQVVTLWDPTNVIVGQQDLRLTLMRLMLDGYIAVTLTNAANPSVTVVSLGIYLGTPTEIRDPSLPAAVDRNTDWLWLNHEKQTIVAASPVLLNVGFQRVLQNTTANMVDLRTKRKLEMDQVISLAIRFNDGNSAATGATVSTNLWTSVLYQRTMRR